MNKYIKILIPAFIGAALGFAYYYYFGCKNGCPLTSRWYVTTIYGMFTGIIAFFPTKKKTK